MNWETNKPFPKNRTIDTDLEDLCEHVEQDHRLAHWVFCEDDCFGPVARFVVCKECKEETLKEMAEEEDCCWDCRNTFKMKDLKEWRGYYFSRNEGDEPLLICKSCWVLPDHQRRIKQKEQDRLFEEESDPVDDHWEEDYEEDYGDYYPEEDVLEESELNEAINDHAIYTAQIAEEQDHSLEDEGINDRD